MTFDVLLSVYKYEENRCTTNETKESAKKIDASKVTEFTRKCMPRHNAAGWVDISNICSYCLQSS